MKMFFPQEGSIYYLDVTMGNVHFTSALFVDPLPLKALPCLFSSDLGEKHVAKPYRPITIWKQWASERDDSHQQQSSHHSGSKRDNAGRECTIICMPSLKAGVVFCLVSDTHNTYWTNLHNADM